MEGDGPMRAVRFQRREISLLLGAPLRLKEKEGKRQKD